MSPDRSTLSEICDGLAYLINGPVKTGPIGETSPTGELVPLQSVEEWDGYAEPVDLPYLHKLAARAVNDA